MNEGPIAAGWNTVLNEAPTADERKNAEKFRDIFYAGAGWLWQIVKEFDDDEEFKRYLTEAIEEDLQHWRATRQQRRPH